MALRDAVGSFAHTISSDADLDHDPRASAELLERLSGNIAREAAGSRRPGLAAIGQLLARSFQLRARNSGIGESARGELIALADALIAYVDKPTDFAAESLVSSVRAAPWIVGLGLRDAVRLVIALKQASAELAHPDGDGGNSLVSLDLDAEFEQNLAASGLGPAAAGDSDTAIASSVEDASIENESTPAAPMDAEPFGLERSSAPAESPREPSEENRSSSAAPPAPDALRDPGATATHPSESQRPENIFATNFGPWTNADATHDERASDPLVAIASPADAAQGNTSWDAPADGAPDDLNCLAGGTMKPVSIPGDTTARALDDVESEGSASLFDSFDDTSHAVGATAGDLLPNADLFADFDNVSGNNTTNGPDATPRATAGGQPPAVDLIAEFDDMPDGGGTAGSIAAPQPAAGDPPAAAELFADFDDLPTGGETDRSMAAPLPGSGLSPDDELLFAEGDTLLTAHVVPADAARSAEQPPSRALSRPASSTLSPGARQLVEVLIAELPEIHATIAAFSGLSRGEHVSQDLIDESQARCTELFQRFGDAAESVGFAGLGRVFAQARRNLGALHADGQQLTAEQAELLVDMGVLVRAYLSAPLAPESARAMTGWAASTSWPLALDADDASRLRALLECPDFSLLEEGIEPRQTQATAEDVTLQIPRDTDRALLDGMFQELPLQCEEFSAAIERLSHGGSIDDLNIAQRIAHTIKGSGNTAGIRGLATLTHNLEDILLALARAGRMPTARLGETLMSAADCLQGMTEYLLGSGPAPEDSLDVLQEVMNWAARIEAEGLPATDDEAPAPVRAHNPSPSVVAAADHVAEAASRDTPDSPAAGANADAETAAMLRVPATLIDQLLAMAGENILLTGQLRDRVGRGIADLQTMRSQFELLQQLGSELEELIDVKDFGHRQHQASATEFDALEMDQYNELHSYARRLAEAATDARELGRATNEHLADLDEMLVGQEGLNTDNQDLALRLRMVLVKTLFPRLQRSVRQTCRAVGKRVDLHLAGGETPMDGDALNRIADPLMHLLRNAIDHGIEDESTRVETGKSAVGNIHLEFSRDGNSILVRCRDDGAGLDLAAIRRTAIERGLIGESESVADESLKQLILRPNFSTRQSATQVSGRGIGLDAVHTGVNDLGGTLTIDSAPRQGCSFEIRLPFNLISSHTLLVRAGRDVVALASRGIEQIVHPRDGALQDLGGDAVFQIGDNVYAARTLESALGAVDRRTEERGSRPVVLTRTGKSMTAVLVDSVLGSRELVVKALGRNVPKIRGVIGATILGDGKVAAVLDLPDLLSAARRDRNDETETGPSRAASERGRKLALVVDDSLSARRALAQFLQDSGYDVRSARDGIEAAQIAEGRVPDIVLADLEMPRMNGIELAAHLRSRAPTAQVPIIMITSRSTAKHREQAAAAGVNVYLTKPYSEDRLLEHLRELVHDNEVTAHGRTGTFA